MCDSAHCLIIPIIFIPGAVVVIGALGARHEGEKARRSTPHRLLSEVAWSALARRFAAVEPVLEK